VPKADEGVSVAQGTAPHPPFATLRAPSPRKRGEGRNS